MNKHTSVIRTHQGQALLYVANRYPRLIDVTLEIIQNAIDSGATAVAINIDKRKRILEVADNGDGATVDKFNLALRSVCQSLKAEDKLGQFGIGLISPLGKCEIFSFVSCPKKSGGGTYHEWIFKTEAIAAQPDTVEIPSRPITNYIFSTTTKTARSDKGVLHYVNWRTKVRLVNYTSDRTVSLIPSIDSLINDILSRFSVAMRRKNVRLNIRFIDENGTETTRHDIAASPYTGTKLDEYRVRCRMAGQAVFNLYLAKRTLKGHTGKVTLGQLRNDYRFPFGYFIMNAREHLSADVIDCLSSGLIEGEILSEHATLNESRKSFAKNDVLADFCSAINMWYEKVGKQIVLEAKDDSDGLRYQELGLQSLKTIESMLKDDRFAGIADVMATFGKGSVGSGHAPPKRNQIAGNQNTRSVSTAAGSAKSEVASPRDYSGKAPAKVPNPDHQPFTVAGPKGKRRTLVRHDSLGLQYSHDALAGMDKLWHLDVENGILYFNIRHPQWVACDTGDRAGDRRILQLQEYITIHALLLHATPESWRGVMENTFEDLVSPFTFLIQHSTAFTRKRKE